MSERQEAPKLDTRHAHSARVYNYWLGGKRPDPAVIGPDQVTAWCGVARKG